MVQHQVTGIGSELISQGVCLPCLILNGLISVNHIWYLFIMKNIPLSSYLIAKTAVQMLDIIIIAVYDLFIELVAKLFVFVTIIIQHFLEIVNTWNSRFIKVLAISLYSFLIAATPDLAAMLRLKPVT